MAAFTKTTSFSYSTDAPAYTYTDMRGNAWSISEKSGPQWAAIPSAAAAKAYELRPGKMFNAASDAEMLIDGIEEKLEAARAAGQSPGVFYGDVTTSSFPWWLVALGIAGYLHSKKKRHR